MKIHENRNWPLLCVLILIPIPMVWNGFACLKDPCIHGICIDDLVSNYFCYCIDGYTGIHCQTNWNECWSSPCQNGGICIDGIASFNCSCPPGYTGKTIPNCSRILKKHSDMFSRPMNKHFFTTYIHYEV